MEDIDLSKFPKGEPKELWDRLEPSQKSSLLKLAYVIKRGDIIYVKEGKRIVCGGEVTGPYRYDRKGRIRAPGELPFRHQVPVEWQRDFVPIDILLGAEPLAVLELNGERLERLLSAVEAAAEPARSDAHVHAARRVDLVAIEGKAYRAEVLFRKRNRALIEAKKLESDGKCDVCRFDFMARYTGLKRDCLEAHHKKPMAKRAADSETTMNDIDLLCPNCHAAIHTGDPPLSAGSLRAMLFPRD